MQIRRCLSALFLLLLVAVPLTAIGQESPPAMVQTYDALADAILAMKQAEADFVRSLLSHHYEAGHMHHALGHPEQAATEMALFANEGDNAVAGVRKRLLDGGHHHHSDGEAEGIYEEGYVVVTREAKAAMLAAAAAMRAASDEAAQREAWHEFMAIAKPLLEPAE
jgi:hypothetical protein